MTWMIWGTLFQEPHISIWLYIRFYWTMVSRCFQGVFNTRGKGFLCIFWGYWMARSKTYGCWYVDVNLHVSGTWNHHLVMVVRRFLFGSWYAGRVTFPLCWFQVVFMSMFTWFHLEWRTNKSLWAKQTGGWNLKPSTYLVWLPPSDKFQKAHTKQCVNLEKHGVWEVSETSVGSEL